VKNRRKSAGEAKPRTYFTVCYFCSFWSNEIRLTLETYPTKL